MSDQQASVSAASFKGVPMYLLITVFVLGTLMIQGTYTVTGSVAAAFALDEGVAGLINTIPTIVLGIVCMLYGTLCDYLSSRKLAVFGIICLAAGSLVAFLGSASFYAVLLGRVLQTAGGQVCGTIFLVLTFKYFEGKEQAGYIGVFNAAYYLAACIGIFAGGFIAAIDWRIFFVVPVISLLFLPVIIKKIPDVSASGDTIDWVGIGLFALFAGFLALYFAFMELWMVLAAVVTFVVFAIYIAKAKHPFLTKGILGNPSYMLTILFLFVLWLTNFICVPLYQTVGSAYGLDGTQTITICLTIMYAVATAVALCSGPVINAIGRTKTLYLAMGLMIVGFIASALTVGMSNIILMTFLGCLFLAGATIAYTPVYDNGSEALPQEESGRGAGIMDLILNTSGSIGYAIYTMISMNPSMGEPGSMGYLSNLFWVVLVVPVVALVLFLIVRKKMIVTVPENTNFDE